MYQFFVEPGQIQGKQVFITGGDVNHIKNVLRMKVGEELAVSNGIDGKEYRCGIVSMTDDAVTCELRFIKEDGIELPTKIYLFQALPKADKMELIIQKAVELGAYEIIPVATKRCVVKLDDKKAKNKIARWQSISEAAAKQSKRKVIPQVHDVMTFGEAVTYAGSLRANIIPYELAEGMDATRELMTGFGREKPESIGVFIGPEGGFDEAEIARAMEQGIKPVTLGKRILRTETAGFTTLAFLMYHLES